MPQSEHQVPDWRNAPLLAGTRSTASPPTLGEVPETFARAFTQPPLPVVNPMYWGPSERVPALLPLAVDSPRFAAWVAVRDVPEAIRTAPVPVTSLEIQVDGLRSAKGMIRVCLTADPGNFPACIDDRHAVRRSVPADQRVIRFEGLAPGTYAAALIHDENSNARLDTLMGIPREGFGFSRNPRIGFGPPRFSAAEFALGSVAETQQVTMRYLL